MTIPVIKIPAIRIYISGISYYLFFKSAPKESIDGTQSPTNKA